jgi:hypothetical protein
MTRLSQLAEAHARPPGSRPPRRNERRVLVVDRSSGEATYPGRKRLPALRSSTSSSNPSAPSRPAITEAACRIAASTSVSSQAAAYFPDGRGSRRHDPCSHP